MIKNNKNKGLINLKSGFEFRKKNIHNRASAVFPIYITKNNDFYLVFFNYWKKKNNIKITSISLVIYIYNEKGNLIRHFNSKINEHHNQFSVKSILGKEIKKNFAGSVNIEILSLEKLSFPFPAVIGVYKSGNLYSSVHSAGRIKNLNEKHEINYTEETNWSCKFNNGITPFFHYFMGPTKPSNNYITVTLFSFDKKIKKKKKISIKNLKPFSSKIFFIKKIFGKINYLNSDFVSVKVEHNSVFPRLVVGNFHEKNSFFETTHSFPFIYNKDHCPVLKDKPIQSKLSAYRNNELDLYLKVFPTNCPGSFKGKFFIKRFNQKKLNSNGRLINFSPRVLSKTKIFPVKNNDQFLSLRMYGNKIPSRFNASFIYKVKNTKSNYSVDVADGARSCITPGKISHWGHGYIGEKYETAIMIINDNYKNNNNETAFGELNIYSSNLKKKRKIKIEPDSLLILKISEIKNLSILRKKHKFFSWFLKLKKPGCEAFWISYRKSDGAIFGDHSF